MNYLKLPFEEWILSQEIPKDAKDLINEAILCYKSNAYRASLLFSYLCFQTIIRDRLLNSQKPDNIPERMWGKIHKHLRNEDTWDQTVYENLQRQQPREIFILNDDLRNQITYWKNRRNDCAHSKENIIGFSHVESFWSFIRSNLSKIMVNGSREALLNKIKRHFNISLTAPNTDISYIINEIPYAVEESELVLFFNSVFEYFKEEDGPLWDINDYYLEFWDKIFSLNNEKVTHQLIQFLKSNEDLVILFLRNHSQRITYFADDTSFIRNLWHSRIFENGFDAKGDLKLYCAILRNGLIESNQLSEANEKIIFKYENVIPEEDDFYILKENNFFQTFKEVVFNTTYLNNFDKANNRKEIIIYYLERFPIDEHIVQSITSVFDYNVHPWHLRNSLNKFFAENQEKRTTFLDILDELELEIPKYLSSLKESVSN